MQETPAQYTRRILGYQKGKRAVTVLSRTPRAIGRLIARAPRRTLAAPPGPGRWSVGEILAHMADTELTFGFRMRLVLGSNGVRIQAFDQDVWATNFRYDLQDPRDSFDAYRVERAHNLRLLRLLPPPMWNYYGMHDERGKESVRRMTEMMAGHDLNHLDQIRKILTPPPRPRGVSGRP
ncbi:MAG TPA: DinB family protein [Bacteroidota bacterium]|nr:DinB family protein [Bacteroidota bacterium]